MPKQEIFVFGSNLAGRHGKGAALYANQHHGAIYGQAVGLQGNSYAIPTKDEKLNTLPLEVIASHVWWFISRAMVEYKHLTFNVTPIGCGLAGYTPAEIAPMFQTALELHNVKLPPEFIEILKGDN